MKTESIVHKQTELVAYTRTSDLGRDAVGAISANLRQLLADVFALYLKTKNFHWHMTGPHFRDYHTLLDDQSDQILAATDLIAERVRKVGGTTLRSVAHIACLQRVIDNDSGIGTQFVVADVNGDKLPDVVVSNKKGTFVFEQIRTGSPLKSIKDTKTDSR